MPVAPHSTSAAPAVPNAPPPTQHLILTVHGIRTYGHWQDRLRSLVATNSTSDDIVDIRAYRYGYFTIFSFLVPWLRNIAVRQFHRHLLSVLSEARVDRIDVVAHSFGTYLAVRGIHMLGSECDARINTTILSGSVIPSDYSFDNLVGPNRRIKRLVNDCGTKDGILLLTLFIVGVGMGGRIGFHGFQSNFLVNRFFPFSHSGYFEAHISDADMFMREWWIPLLNSNDPARQGPDRPLAVPLLERLVRTLGENGASVTALFYAFVFLSILTPIIYYWNQAQNEAEAALRSEIAKSAEASIYSLQTGRELDAIHELSVGLSRTKRRPLVRFYPELLSAMRTANTEFSEIAYTSKGSGPVVDANFSRDGSQLVTTGLDGGIQVWDIDARGAPHYHSTIVSLLDDIRHSWFTPDNHFIVTIGKRVIKLWNAAGEIKEVRNGLGGSITSFAVGRGDTGFVTGEDTGAIALWSYKNKTPQILKTSGKSILDLAFSHNGQFIASASSDGTAQIWDTETGRNLRTFSSNSDEVTSVNFGNDDHLLAVTTIGGSLTFWSLTTGIQISSVKNYNYTSGKVNTFGTVYATFPYKFLPVKGAPAQVWDLHQMSLGSKLFNADNIKDVIFSPQGYQHQIATISDREVRLWHTDGNLLKIFRTPDDRELVLHAAFSPDGTKIVVIYSDGAIRILNALMSPFGGVSKTGSVFNIEPVFIDDKTLAVPSPGFVKFFEFPSLEEKSELSGEWTTPRTIALSENKELLIGEASEFAPVVTIRNLTKEVRLGTCGSSEGETNGSYLAAFSADGTKIAVEKDFNDPIIHICDSKTGEQEREFQIPGAVTSESAIALSSRAMFLAAGGVERSGALWKTSGGEPIARLSAGSARISALTFSRDESMLACGFDDGSVIVWNTKKNKSVSSINFHEGITSVSFDNFGANLAIGRRDGGVTIFDLKGNVNVGSFKSTNSYVRGLKFSPNNDYLTAIIDEKVWRWNIVDEDVLLSWLAATTTMEKDPPTANHFFSP